MNSNVSETKQYRNFHEYLKSNPVYEARQDVPAVQFDPRPATQPTDAPLGSPARVAVMRARVERGESLYHPDDNPVAWDGEA